MNRAFTIDAGVLLGARRRGSAAWKWMESVWDRGLTAWLPSVVLAQVWRHPPEAFVPRLVAGCQIQPLDAPLARAAGELLGRSGTSDVVDAVVAVTAIRSRSVLLTTDAEGFARLAEHLPSLRFEPI